MPILIDFLNPKVTQIIKNFQFQESSTKATKKLKLPNLKSNFAYSEINQSKKLRHHDSTPILIPRTRKFFFVLFHSLFVLFSTFSTELWMFYNSKLEMLVYLAKRRYRTNICED